MPVVWLTSAFVELQTFFASLNSNNLAFIQQAALDIDQAVAAIVPVVSVKAQASIGAATYSLHYRCADQVYILQFCRD